MADHNKPVVTVETKVDQKPLDKGLEQIKEKVKKAGEEASKPFKEMFKALSLEKLVEKGLEVVKDFFKESVEAAQEAEVNIGQLKNTLTGLGKGKYFDEILKNADELKEKFAVDDDVILETQARLETYGKLTEKQIKDLEPVIINYARKTGKSMDDATTDVLKGLEGQGKAFKTLGVQIKAGGTTAQNLATIMDDLGAKVAGAGEAYKNTAKGGIEAFHIAVEDLQKEVGKNLLPAIGDLARGFMPLIKEIEPLTKELVPILIGSLKSLAPLLKSLGEIIIKVLKPIGELFSIVASALNDLMPALTPVLDAFGEFSSAVISALIPPIKLLIDEFSVLLKEILPPLKFYFEALTKIWNVVGRVTNILYVAITKLVQKFNDWIKPIKGVSGAFEFFNKIVTGVVTKLKEAYKWVSDLLDKVEDFLGIKREKQLEEAGDAAKKTGDAAKKTGDEIVQADNKVDKNAEKLAKQAQKRDEELAKLKAKYLLDAREQLIAEQKNEYNLLVKKYPKEKALLAAAKAEQAKVLQDFDYKAQKAKDDIEQEAFDRELKIQQDLATSRQKDYEAQIADKKAATEKLIDNNKLAADMITNQENDLDDFQFAAKQELEEKKQALQMESLQIQHDADVEAANGNADAILDIERRFQVEKKKLEDAADEQKKNATLATISAINGYEQQGLAAAQSLADIADNAEKSRLAKGEKLSEETQKKQFKRKQALSLASAILSTAEGVAKSVAESPETGGLPGSAIAALIGGLQIAKILSTKFSADSSGSGGSSAAPSTPSISAGQTVGLGSQKPNLQLYNDNSFKPQKVFVTQTDISRVDNKVNVIQNRSVLK